MSESIRPILITGMHRSGTSLVASLVQAGGVSMGDRLIGPDTGNPRGHFEDKDFCDFHAKLLARAGLDAFVQDPAQIGGFTPEDVQNALALIQQRSAYTVWGWKDPRTSLFLGPWHDLLPGARFIFVYRHPLEVVASLLRRGTDMQVLEQPLVGLRAWQAYNQSLLAFTQRYPHSVLLGNIAGIVSDIPSFYRRISGSPRQMADSSQGDRIYQAEELRQIDISAEATRELLEIAPVAMALYASLEALAQWPSPTGQHASALHSLGVVALPTAVLPSRASLPETELGMRFSALVARSDIEAAMGAQQALDSYRLEVIRDLGHKLAEHNGKVDVLMLQTTSLQQALAESEAQRAEQLADHQQALDQSQAQLEALRTDVALQTQRRMEAEEQAQRLEGQLNVIEHSRAWQLILQWYKLRIFARRAARIGPPAVLPAPRGVPRARPNRDRPYGKTGTPQPASTPKVLFISHDANRQGAPIVLLQLLRWVKANTEIEFEILLKSDGELRPDFEALAPVTVLASWGHLPDPEAARQWLPRFEQANIKLIYANTITNGDILGALAPLQCPVICHVHELDYWIKYRTAPGNNHSVKKHTTRYIAVSHAVKNGLVRSLDLPTDCISVAYGFVAMPAARARPTRATAQIRRQLALPPDAFVVGAAGTTDWRKGADIFVQLARVVAAREPRRSIHFVWLGGENRGPAFEALWHDVSRMGLGERVHFLGARPNPLDYIDLFDVFALVSREDPFPLVNLEAASLGKPSVCFAGSGGASEFVEADSGFVVPYLDVEAMADRILDLLRSPELRSRLGQCAAEKVRQRHAVDVVAPQIARIIQRFLPASTP